MSDQTKKPVYINRENFTDKIKSYLKNPNLSINLVLMDMEEYINNNSGQENLQIVRDVMETLTSVRNQWGMVYDFE